jgi:hypothetical protein
MSKRTAEAWVQLDCGEYVFYRLMPKKVTETYYPDDDGCGKAGEPVTNTSWEPGPRNRSDVFCEDGLNDILGGRNLRSLIHPSREGKLHKVTVTVEEVE